MITILVDTKDEYDEMLLFAKKWVCIRIPFIECLKYDPNGCEECYVNNRAKCGIRVIPPVDSDK